jgi:hypothetical protein
MYTSHDCCSHHHCPPPCVYVPVVWVPLPDCCCETITVPRDLTADAKTPTQTSLVGGADPVSLSVEYLVPQGAPSPSVKLSATAPDGTVSDWSVTAPSTGYHVEEAVLSVKAGTLLTLTVKAVTARVRWCERICC